VTLIPCEERNADVIATSRRDGSTALNATPALAIVVCLSVSAQLYNRLETALDYSRTVPMPPLITVAQQQSYHRRRRKSRKSTRKRSKTRRQQTDERTANRQRSKRRPTWPASVNLNVIARGLLSGAGSRSFADPRTSGSPPTDELLVVKADHADRRLSNP